MKRRNFLHNLGHLSALSMLPSEFLYGQFAGSNSALSNTNTRGRILVVVKLSGGNDGLNTLIPLDQYGNLNNVRPHVILPENSIINLGKNDLGLHPELNGFKSLHDEKRLKIIQNVGYEQPDFSHFRSQDIWQSASDSNKYVSNGWLGRYIENMHPDFPESYPNNQFPDPIAVNLSGGSDILFTGRKGYTAYTTYDPNEFYSFDIDQGIEYSGVNFASKRLNYIKQVARQSNIYSQNVFDAYTSSDLQNSFPNSDLGRQLEIVAKLINGGLNSRIYMVELGGFDTHDSQVIASDHTQGEHASLLKNLNDNILSFMQCMDDIDRSDDVLVMTFSEFGRTIASNGSLGTDHGTAAPLFVFGNKVDSTILGNNPVIPSNAEWQDNLATEFDFRQVYSSIMNQWLTVNPTTEEDVLFKKFDQLPIIQGKYIDTDGDGVSDDRDLCNATPLGAMVNTDGCEIFSLPVDNFSIQTNGVSCSGKSNGQITISIQNTDHIYNLSIPEIDSTYVLDTSNQHQLIIDELGIDTYTLNFTVEGQEGYLQTFEIGITEPPALSAKSSVNQKSKTIQINVKGSDLYYTEVNGEKRSYQIDNFKLQLRSGMNIIKISTPQDCQGVHTEKVFISEQVKHYPNPVLNTLNIVIPGEDNSTTVKVYDRSGNLINRYQESISFSRMISINTSQLPSDIYVVKVNGQTVDQTFKMIKR